MIINTLKPVHQDEQNFVFSVECLRELAERERLLEMYSVHYFSILHGGYEAINPLYAARESAQTFLAGSKANYPDSYISRFEFYFTSEHEEGRKELLSKLRLIDES